jgi:CheY-like chemotaxis protein
VATVLLVDDSEATREVLRLYAEGRGLEVVGEAVDGRAAVALAERLQPDAIVLDEDMPEMTGLEAMPLLRQGAPRSVIVFYSSLPRHGIESRALAAGARAYFEKGGSLRPVIDCIVALTSSRGS